MRIKCENVYQFDELSDKAKETARDWYRQGGLDYEWWESTYDDAENIGLKITAFDLRGLCEGHFIGTALDTVEKILKDHGDVCETYKTAKRYEPALRDADPESDEYENTVHEFLLDLLEDYRIILQHEEDYLTSAEYVDETIRANEYEFYETGRRA